MSWKNPKLLKTPSYFAGVWVTDACNKRCRYCFYGLSDIFEGGWKPTYMNTTVADAFVRFINEGNVSGMSFFGGEPLMNWPIVKRILAKSHLPLIVQGLGQMNRPYNITTNGTLITQEIIDELRLYDVHINLSIDGTRETQNHWRDNSYDAIVKNLDLFLDYPGLQILKTLADPSTLYEDVKHIKELGFKRMFINLMNPYGDITYEGYDVEDFKRQYKRVITELHGDSFTVSDYLSWMDLIKPGKERTMGCGFYNRGSGIAPDGSIYPCHEGPSLRDKEKFKIGDVFKGIDMEREKIVRKVDKAPTCLKCDYRLNKCVVSMYNKYGRFGIDPPKWHTDFEVAKLQVLEEQSGFKRGVYLCQSTEAQVNTKAFLLATLVNSEKYYLLKPFLESIATLEVPPITDYYLLVDDTDRRLNILLAKWLDGQASKLPSLGGKFRNVQLLKIPTVQGESFMHRITRGRNIVLGIARKNREYGAYGFIDADIIAPHNTITDLLATNGDIVGALVYCRRGNMTWPNNYRILPSGEMKTVTEFGVNEILSVDMTGSDCLIIRRPVFKKIMYEYKPEIPEAEDMGFCKKARKLGFSVKINTGVQPKHVDIDDIEVKTK